MSCYTCFFIRSDNHFLRVGCYSRNSSVARALHEVHVAPWEKITNMDEATLHEARDYAQSMIHISEEVIEDYKDEIDMILEMNVPDISIEEKLDKISEFKRFIEEAKEDIKDWEYADYFFRFLENAIEDAKYCRNDEIDPNHYIYWGLEIDSPTVDDIV